MNQPSLAILSTHPIQYLAPLYRKLIDTGIIVQVYYASDFSVRGAFDPGFSVDVAWDTPILEGYPSKFLIEKRNTKSQNGYWAFNRPEIFREFRQNRFDAILIPGYSPFYYLQAIFAAKLVGRPVLMRGETTDRGKKRGSIKRIIRKILLQLLYQQFAVCMPIGKNSRDHYRAHGVSDEKMVFSPYCVDNHLFQSEAEKWKPFRNNIRKELDIGENDLVIVFSGKLTNVKDVFTLARAVGSLDRRVSILWIGDGQLRAELEVFCSNQKEKKHNFVGFQNQSQISKYYAASDVLVLPSLGETWGLVVNEFMNFGKPVIVSDRVGCAPDLIQQGETGFVFPVGDSKSLAEYLDIFASDLSLIDAMGSKALEQVSRYSVERAAEGVINALKYVVQSHKLPPLMD